MDLRDRVLGSPLAWDSGSNLLAMPVRNGLSKKIELCIVSPSNFEEHALFALPGEIEGDHQLVSLEWSPVEQKRVLLATTASGKCLMWSHASSSTRPDTMLTLSDWQCQQSFQLPFAPVAVRWLGAPSCWKWPRDPLFQGSARPQGIEGPFGPHASTQQQLPWVRPGTLACAAIMRDATFQVAWWGRAPTGVESQWHQSSSVTLPVSGDLVAVDIAVTTSGVLRVLVVCSSEPSKATILTVSGNPTALRPDGKPYEELHIEYSATRSLTSVGQSIRTALFQPDSAGTAAVLLSHSTAGNAMVSQFRENAGIATWTQAASFKVAGDGHPESAVLLSQSHDGASLLLSHPLSSKRTHLSVLDSETLEVLRPEIVPGECRGIAASPNMCCAVTAHPDPTGKGSRLLVHELPAKASSAAEAVNLLSLRVCWSLVRRTSTWDVLRHVEGCSREQPNLAAELLAHLDTALHSERYTQRPAYGMVLNAFKLQLLAGNPDATARSVCMDIWASSYLQNLAGPFKLMCRPDKTAPESLLGQVMVSAEDAAAVEPWVAWVEGFVPFVLGCLRRWVQARQQAGSDPSKCIAADALPCVRLLPDAYFAKNLTEVVAACEVACRALESSSSPGPRSAEVKKMESAVRALSAVIVQDQRAADLANSMQSEEHGAHLAAARHAQGIYSGAYGLHYYRTLGGVRPVEAFTDASSGQLIAPLHDSRHWSDSEIEAASGRLGLTTPPRASHNTSRKRRLAEAASLPPLHLDEGPFCVQGPELVDMHLRRKRWRAEHASALGSAKTDTGQWKDIDIITGARFSWAMQPTLVSYDGLCSTAGVNAGDLSSSGLYNKAFCSTVLSACPVTGSSWRRVRL